MARMGKDTFVRIRTPGGAGGYIMAPVLTTTQRDALTGEEGMIIFNSTTDQLEEYDGSTWEAVGQVIMTTHEADFGLHRKVLIKTADQTVNTSTSLVDVDDLVLPVGANDVWWFELWLRINSGTTPDIKHAFSIPSGGGGAWITNATHGSSNALTNARTTQTDGADMIVNFYGLYIGGGTAGNLQLQFAQNVSNGSDTKTLKNSVLIGHQVV